MKTFDSIENGDSGDVTAKKTISAVINPFRMVVVGISAVNLIISIVVVILLAVWVAPTTTTTTTTSAPVPSSCGNGPLVSKNIKDLTPEEKMALVEAFKLMKKVPSAYNLSTTFDAAQLESKGQPKNAYDYFVAIHWEATIPASQGLNAFSLTVDNIPFK